MPLPFNGTLVHLQPFISLTSKMNSRHCINHGGETCDRCRGSWFSKKSLTAHNGESPRFPGRREIRASHPCVKGAKERSEVPPRLPPKRPTEVPRRFTASSAFIAANLLTSHVGLLPNEPTVVLTRSKFFWELIGKRTSRRVAPRRGRARLLCRARDRDEMSSGIPSLEGNRPALLSTSRISAAN